VKPKAFVILVGGAALAALMVGFGANVYLALGIAYFVAAGVAITVGSRSK
jgi:hypothetical protein